MNTMLRCHCPEKANPNCNFGHNEGLLLEKAASGIITFMHSGMVPTIGQVLDLLLAIKSGFCTRRSYQLY